MHDKFRATSPDWLSARVTLVIANAHMQLSAKEATLHEAGRKSVSPTDMVFFPRVVVAGWWNSFFLT